MIGLFNTKIATKEEKAWRAFKRITDKYQKKPKFDWTYALYEEHRDKDINHRAFLEQYGKEFFAVTNRLIEAGNYRYGWLREMVLKFVDPAGVSDAELLKNHAADYIAIGAFLNAPKANHINDSLYYLDHLTRINCNADHHAYRVFDECQQDIAAMAIENLCGRKNVEYCSEESELCSNILSRLSSAFIVDFEDKLLSFFEEDIDHSKVLNIINNSGGIGDELIVKYVGQLDEEARGFEGAGFAGSVRLARKVKNLSESDIGPDMQYVSCTDQQFIRDVRDRRQDLIGTMVTFNKAAKDCSDKSHVVFVERVPHAVRTYTDDSDNMKVALKAHYEDAIYTDDLSSEMSMRYGEAGLRLLEGLKASNNKSALTKYRID